MPSSKTCFTIFSTALSCWLIVRATLAPINVKASSNGDGRSATGIIIPGFGGVNVRGLRTIWRKFSEERYAPFVDIRTLFTFQQVEYPQRTQIPKSRADSDLSIVERYGVRSPKDALAGLPEQETSSFSISASNFFQQKEQDESVSPSLTDMAHLEQTPVPDDKGETNELCPWQGQFDAQRGANRTEKYLWCLAISQGRSMTPIVMSAH